MIDGLTDLLEQLTPWVFFIPNSVVRNLRGRQFVRNTSALPSLPSSVLVPFSSSYGSRSSMGLFNRKAASSPETSTEEPKTESTASVIATSANHRRKSVLPTYNHNGHLVTRGIHPDGESGRSGKTPSLPSPYQISGMAYTPTCWTPRRTPLESLVRHC